MESEIPNVRGKRFYRPWVLFLYSVLANFPIAIFLYGINVRRRGNRVAGSALKGVAAVMMAMITIMAITGTSVKAIHWVLIGIAIGIGLMQAEKNDYDKCIAQGALAAKWWPPLLVLLVQFMVVFMMAGIHDR